MSDEADWAHFDRLLLALNEEMSAKSEKRVYPEELPRQIQAVRRIAANELHFFLGWVHEEAVAFFSCWPGVEGVGMVEDLFTLPSHRHRGIARALIHRCVADARARGAEAVLVGSDARDTPKAIYASMGFRPTCLTTNWLSDTAIPPRGSP